MTDSPSLARIRLNPDSRDVCRDLRDATEMHRTLMRLVPDGLGDAPRRQAGLLYRLEESPSAQWILVQAFRLAPERLPEGYGRIEVKSLAPMLAALRKGLGVRYRIVVNPSKRQRLPPEHQGRRGPVVALSGPEADQWWLRRAAEAGLAVQVLTPTTVAPARGRHHDGMRHSLLRYDGTATVHDPDALRDAVLHGIGRGKSYGAGLLSLAPAGVS
jgi:CRISPR system Cascade subunit CasE